MSAIVSLELVQVTCYRHDCGVSFGLAQNHYRGLRESHKTFYCPNGHAQAFLIKSELERAQERAARLESDLSFSNRRREELFEQAEAERRSHATTRGHLTRVKNRAHAGVCLHCNRTFGNLARHVKTKHPEHAKTEEP